jgi:hypothetical protein
MNFESGSRLPLSSSSPVSLISSSDAAHTADAYRSRCQDTFNIFSVHAEQMHASPDVKRIAEVLASGVQGDLPAGGATFEGVSKPLKLD